MRKTTFVSALSCCVSLFCLVALGLLCRPALAQNATPAAAPVQEIPAVTMPSDPKELMLLAAKTNGLIGDDMKPWHLKASWKMLDEKGGLTDQGTFEELWVSPKKFKRTFTGVAFTQSFYRTEEDFMRSGVQKLPSELISDVRRELVEPMPDERTAQYMSFHYCPATSRTDSTDCKYRLSRSRSLHPEVPVEWAFSRTELG
jgi:hypothetical protein